MFRTSSQSATASSPVGAGTTTGPYTGSPDADTIVGTPCAPYVAAAFSWSARTSSDRRWIGDRPVDERGVEAVGEQQLFVLCR